MKNKSQLCFICLLELCLLKIFRPDKILQSMKNFIRIVFGDKRFNSFPEIDLKEALELSNPTMPIILIEQHGHNSGLQEMEKFKTTLKDETTNLIYINLSQASSS